MATRDYTLGKGKVLFKPEGEAAYMDLGNAPAFAINVNVEKLEHFSSREGLSLKDLEVITRLGMGGSFTLDEPKAANLAMFAMSDAGATADAQSSGSTAAASIATIILDRWYPMTLAGTGTASLPASATALSENVGTAAAALSGTTAEVTGPHTVKVLVVTAGTTGTSKISVDGADWSTGGARTTGGTNSIYTCVNGDGETEGIVITFDVAANLAAGDVFTFAVGYSGATRLTNLTSATVSGSVEGTDFVLDKKAGLFMALSAGNIAAASTVTFATTVYAANAGRTSTTGATLTSLKGDLYFVGDPPQGRVIDVMGFCALTPNGDLSLIGTDWMQVQFNVEFLQVEGVEGLVTLQDRGKIG